jgi:hypothetical protein
MKFINRVFDKFKQQNQRLHIKKEATEQVAQQATSQLGTIAATIAPAIRTGATLVFQVEGKEPCQIIITKSAMTDYFTVKK